MKIDFNQWLGKRWNRYGMIEMTVPHCSHAFIGFQIDEKEYELSCILEESEYESEIYNLEFHFGYTEDYEEIEVNEIIQSIHLVYEEQKYYEDNVLSSTKNVLRAILICTDSNMYSFEKDDVSFSEIIRIDKGKNLLSKYPHSNLWLEEEAFYGMDELKVECTQSISSYERKEMIFKITNKEYPMVQDFILKHSHCSDFSYTFKKDFLCVECTCKEKLILSRKDCE